jgi:hypothetical protein
MGNIIRTFSLHDQDDLIAGDPWDGILAATMFALRATYHTTLQATPTQLVFGRDAIMNVQYKADWAAIKERKQKLINKNNAAENKKRKAHTYHVGDKILIRKECKSKYGDDPYSGPYVIEVVNSNGTLRYRDGAITDVINIRNCTPYYE